jgi:hypothetical protein
MTKVYRGGVLAGAMALALLLCGCAGLKGGGGGKAVAQVGLSLAAETRGATVAATLSASNATGLHQLACRVSYDPLAVRPAGAERGALVDGRAAFFSTTKAEGYVPVAFTYHPGEALPAGSGSVATLQFDVLDPSRDPDLTLIRDPEFLIARDALRRDIPVVVGATR